MIRFIVPIYMLGTALITAIFLIIVTHFGFGIARSTIRTDALVGIIFVGTVLVGSALISRDR